MVQCKRKKIEEKRQRNDGYAVLSCKCMSMLFFPANSVQLNYEYFKKLDNFLGPQMSQLASDISEQYSRRPNT